MRAQTLVVAAIIGISIIQVASYSPLLPDRLATHFAADGTPNGWSDKSSCRPVYPVFVAAMSLLFLGMARLTTKMPDGLINLPRKDYWLAPERREETMRRLGDRLAWMGPMIGCFLLLVGQSTIQANMAKPPRLPGTHVAFLTAGFIISTLWWAAGFLMMFRVPPEACGRG